MRRAYQRKPTPSRPIKVTPGPCYEALGPLGQLGAFGMFPEEFNFARMVLGALLRHVSKHGRCLTQSLTARASQVLILAGCCSTHGLVLRKRVRSNGRWQDQGTAKFAIPHVEFAHRCRFCSSALKADYALHFAVRRAAGGATRAAQKKQL